MSSYFSFNGTTSRDMGLEVERIRPLYSPKKRIVTQQVPGRSGDLHIWDGSYENYPISYQCWFKKPEGYENMAQRAHVILEWLNAAPMGAALADSYDPLVMHRASYIGGAEIENIRNRYGRFTITFDCDPRAFILAGDELSTSPGIPAVAINTTPFPALPLIEVTPAAKAFSGALTFAGKSGTTTANISFHGISMNKIYIDCDLKEAWEIVDGVSVSRNADVAVSQWPVIGPNSTTEVSVSGDIKEAIIKPRWWTL